MCPNPGALRHITVFSSALHNPYLSDGRPAQILVQFAGTVSALASAMAGRPRVIVALPDWTEGSLVANWLSENQFEPVHRSTMEAAASEMRTRPFSLIIADAIWAGSNAFQTPDRGCNPTAPNSTCSDVFTSRTKESRSGSRFTVQLVLNAGYAISSRRAITFICACAAAKETPGLSLPMASGQRPKVAR